MVLLFHHVLYSQLVLITRFVRNDILFVSTPDIYISLTRNEFSSSALLIVNIVQIMGPKIKVDHYVSESLRR